MPYLGVLGEVPGKKRGISMMGSIDYLMILGTIAPALALWVAVVVFAAVRLKRGGSRAERFLIAGASLKIISNLLGAAAVTLLPWLINEGYRATSVQSINFGYGIFYNVIGMAGIICLVYAFWVKFKARDFEVVESINKEQTQEVTP